MSDDDDDICDYCGGSGTISGQDYDGQVKTSTCPSCGGSGKK